MRRPSPLENSPVHPFFFRDQLAFLSCSVTGGSARQPDLSAIRNLIHFGKFPLQVDESILGCSSLILTGATGTVGAPILRHCLESAQITQLSILARKPFTLPEGLNVTKARTIIHEDYAAYSPDVLEHLQGADGCIWAQGTSQTSVSEKEYIRITHDFPVAAAKAFAALSSTGKFNFVHVSGKGAESNVSLYGRTKARAEKTLLELPATSPYETLRVFNVRPAYVDSPAYHPRPGMGRKIVYYGLAPLLRRVTPGLVTPTNALAKVCVDLAIGDGGPVGGADVAAEGRTLLPAAVKRLGELD